MYHLKRRGALGESSLSSFAKSAKTRQRRRFHIVCQTSIWTLLHIGDDGGDGKDNGHGPTVNWSPIQLVHFYIRHTKYAHLHVHLHQVVRIILRTFLAQFGLSIG